MAQSNKIFDLAKRTYTFARDVRKFARRVPKDVCNIEDVKQLVKSSGSVGANYIEANEALSRKDFFYRIKVCRKESKESAYWLRLLYLFDKKDLNEIRTQLIDEAEEMIKIFSSIAKSQKAS
ncbi:MAG: four helix bundle protein [Balneola sp.]|nr:four helix bundle protein [Balneola sp.]|tara:strand:+ start:1901 stop:2266 length:366 start_codon:yes stop_codon:yes gene_type:complete